MKYISVLCLSAVLMGCASSYHSKEFTKEGSFTSGIEGPATDSQGTIYAVNYKEQGTIGKITPAGESTVFVTLPNGSIGNGIRFGQQHQMFVADYVNHNILEIDMSTKHIEVYAHEPTASQPNDIAIARDGTIYASDPNWADNTGKIWKVTKTKGFELLEDNMGTTNGIEVSPDGKKLYVNESVQRKIWVYDIGDNGVIKNKQELISFADFGLDGMRCDREGNLYVTRYDKGTVVVLSPTGTVLKEYRLKGKKPSNLTFSPDFKTIYVTLADKGNIEVIRL
ncbi:SMP-30/gluconolactonase/LRE family protein [Gelidibacter sp. F2691]|nr:SMP-30/gluconolactonase/LRE family protein [Gelidibacter sp. F2691]